MVESAVILAGGFGTRLGEVTESVPKPMVNIGSKPIIWHIMKNYSKFGINKFVILAGYKSEKIKEYFINFNSINSDIHVEISLGKLRFINENKEDWNVTILDTGNNILTGTRVKKSEPYIDSDNFYLTYGDGLSDVDHSLVMEKMLTGKKLIALTAVKPPSRYGQLVIEKGLVSSFEEKKPETGYINGGFFAVSREIFKLMDSTNFSLENDLLPKIAKANNLDAFIHEGFWQSMDTPRDLKLLNDIWENKIAPWKTWKD